jgi:exodeoxyribonuclease V alpha subunit
LASFSDPAPRRETLTGSVERVTFDNEDNGFAALKVKAHGKRDLWITDRTDGLQFKADFLKTTPPTTAEGIEKYLGSGMVRGIISPVLAKRIFAAFLLSPAADKRSP